MTDSAAVYIVDDNLQLLEALQQLFSTVGIASRAFGSAQEFLDHWSPGFRGCLLVDMRMPGISGIDLQARLKKRRIHLPVIFMSGHNNVQSAVHVMKNGALEVLQKPFDHDQLIDEVNKALALEEAQFRSLQKQNQYTRLIDTLTEREREVMEEMVAGATNKEIGKTLNLSPRTVETHRAHVVQKLGVKSVAELVEMAAFLRRQSEE